MVYINEYINYTFIINFFRSFLFIYIYYLFFIYIYISKAYKQIDYTNEFQITESENVLKKLEKDLDDVCFVILSEVFIDKPKVLLKLRTLFEGYSQTIIPYAFIFIGNFSSTPYIYNGKDSMKYQGFYL